MARLPARRRISTRKITKLRSVRPNPAARLGRGREVAIRIEVYDNDGGAMGQHDRKYWTTEAPRAQRITETRKRESMKRDREGFEGSRVQGFEGKHSNP